MPIKASEVGSVIYQMLVDVVDEEYKNDGEDAKQEAIASILDAMSVAYFH